MHVDFLRIGKDGLIRVAVPVKFINDNLSPGLKRGGVLNIVRHDVEVWCPYDKIPPAFVIDLNGVMIGTSIHVSSITMPEGVIPTITDRDFTIATIAGRLKDTRRMQTMQQMRKQPKRRLRNPKRLRRQRRQKNPRSNSGSLWLAGQFGYLKNVPVPVQTGRASSYRPLH